MATVTGESDGKAHTALASNACPTKPPKYIVDRTIHSVLSSPPDTPSSKDGVDPSVERLHRLHGTSLLLDAATILRTSASTYATACLLFHRTYHRISLRKHDVWSIAAACTFLAGKIEEEPRLLRTVVLTYVHIYRRRRLRVGDDVSKYAYGAADAEADGAATLSGEEKENALRHVKPMSVGGPVYAEWKDVVMETESLVLRTLGFVVQWIPDSHPHRFILYFVSVLKIEDEKVIQQAWNYCNDSCRLDLCVRYKPELTACAAILMACADCDRPLPLSPRPWWEVFIGPSTEKDLSKVCNSILAVGDESILDHRRAKYAFVPSLLKEPSFNDPESYLWSVAD